jgi:sugar lactone lactonase YvrE
MMRTLFLLAAAHLSSLAVAHAAAVATWRHSSKADFDRGELQGVVVSRDGEITLGREVRPIADLKCGSVWDLCRSPQGKLYAATALPGQVVQFTADGKLTPVWADDALQAFSLAAGPDGSLLVGTGPAGTIYRISPKGEAKEFYKTGSLYVWDLVCDVQGNVYAATGPKGEIHKINPKGEGRLFYETHQKHVLALALAADGSLLAGTDGAGLVLAIDASGAGRVLYDTSENEVRALWAAADDVIYAGTATGAAAGSTTGTSTSSSSAQPTNSVYRLDADGGVRKVLSAKSLVYSLGPADDASSPEVLAGTGSEGALYLVDHDGRGERQLLALDAELILSLLRGKKGQTFVGTGNPGKLYQLSAQHQSTGTLISPPLDAKLSARFGALVWRAETPPGTQVSLAVRSGNTQMPDDTWSGWSAEQTDAAKAAADCPPARFLQYRVTLKTANPRVTPVVRSVSVRYLTANQPPQITKFTVPHVEEGDGKKLVDKLKLTWTANDPNQDDLAYRLAFRKEGWKSWVTLRDDLTAGEFEWDVTSVPEGIYRVQLEASDRRSNLPEETLTITLVSEPFAVDRTPPRVDARLLGVEGQSARIEARAVDTIGPLVSAAYSLDSEKWVNVFPADSLFDSAREELQVKLSKLSAGMHVLVLRVTDASGQTGSDDVVFEIK